MLHKHFPNKAMLLSSALLVGLLTVSVSILANERPVIEYVNMVKHHTSGNGKCERMKNYILGMSRSELKEQKISRKCIAYARRHGHSYKVEYKKPVTVIKIRKDPPVRSRAPAYTPTYTQLPLTLVKQHGIYRLTAATGLHAAHQVRQNNNKIDWGVINNGLENAKTYYETRALRQFMLAISRDMGTYHHSMLELEWFYAQIKPKRVKDEQCGASWCDPDSDSKYKIDLNAFMLNFYLNTNPNDKVQFVFGLGAGAAFRTYDMFFHDRLLSADMSSKTTKLSWAFQPIVGIRYRLSSVLQLMLDYRLLVMGADKLTNFTSVSNPNIAGTGALYETQFFLHTVNLGIVYQMTHEGNTTDTAGSGVWVH